MPLRKVYDADDALHCLSAARAANEPRAIWARRHGIDPRSLNAWRLNLARSDRGTPATPPRLVELVPAGSVVAAPARYRVLCGEFAVEMDDRFDEAVLRRLLAVVASC